MLGIVIAYWTTFGTRYMAGEWSWRLPFLLQMIPGFILAAGVTVGNDDLAGRISRVLRPSLGLNNKLRRDRAGSPAREPAHQAPLVDFQRLSHL